MTWCLSGVWGCEPVLSGAVPEAGNSAILLQQTVCNLSLSLTCCPFTAKQGKRRTNKSTCTNYYCEDFEWTCASYCLAGESDNISARTRWSIGCFHKVKLSYSTTLAVSAPGLASDYPALNFLCLSGLFSFWYKVARASHGHCVPECDWSLCP